MNIERLKTVFGKSKHSWHMLLFEGILILCMIATIAYIFVSRDYFGNHGELETWYAKEISGSWYYVDANGDIRSLRFPSVIEDNGSGILVIYGKVPYDITNKYFLSTRFIKQDARVYIGGVIRTNFYTKDNAIPYLKDIVSRYGYAPLSIDDGGREIMIEFMGRPGKDHAIAPVIYGEKTGLMAYYLKDNALAFVLGIFLLVVSIVSIIFGAVLKFTAKNRFHLDYAGWALFWVALWSMTQTAYRDLLFNDVRAISIVPIFCLMLLPMALALYMNSIQNGRYSRSYMIFLCVSIAHTLVILVLQMLHVYDFHQATGTTMALLFVLLAAFLVTCYFDYKKGYCKEYSVIIWGVAILGVSGGVQGLTYSLDPFASNPLPLSIGTLIFNVLAVTHTVQTIIRMDSDRNAALQTADVKGQFLATMSHEIRTPINAILGMNEMILRESGENNIKSYAADVDSSGKLLLSLINDILDFSKLDSGKMTIVPGEYDLKSMILTVYHLNEKRAKEKNLEYTLDVDSSLPRRLIGDEVRVSQVITNIVTNAIKYTKEGSVGIRVFSKKTDESQGKDSVLLKIRVSDTGMGIKDEDKDSLFSAFARLDEKKNRTIEGTGLGLAITNELVKLMDGDIDVESVYGCGSVFTISVPQKIVDASPVGAVDVKATTSNAINKVSNDLFTAPEANVLVVDDVEMNIKVFCGLLKKTLVNIDTATSGNAAIELVKNKKYDVIFLDHMMPEKDGVETFHEIRELPDNENHDTPVIMLTANAVAGAREQFLNEGFSDYLSKPFTINEVQTTLLNHLPENKII